MKKNWLNNAKPQGSEIKMFVVSLIQMSDMMCMHILDNLNIRMEC